jgi:hypothetical protein
MVGKSPVIVRQEQIASLELKASGPDRVDAAVQ